MLILSINMLHLSVKWAFFFRTHCTENHLSIECRESSATSVFLEVDFDSFLSLMNFLYFRVVSGNTLFFHLPWSQSFCSGWSENCAYRPADLKENWYGALLEFFFFFFEYHLLTCLASAEAWGWPELCQTNTEVYLIVTCVPFPFLLHPCCHLIPRNYLLSSLLMSGSFGVTWWLFRFTWPLLPSHAPRICIYTYICIYFTCIKYIYIHIYVSIFLCFFACYKTGHKIGTAFNI